MRPSETTRVFEKGELNMNWKSLVLSLVASALAVFVFTVSGARAATTTGTFTSTVTIEASCEVISTNTLDFGTQGILTSDVDASASFNVQCTDTTTYNIGLNAGSTAGGTVSTRLMTDGSDTVAYQLFSDAGRTTNWGNTPSVDTVAGTGNGAEQTLTVYGRIPVQDAPAPSTYTDTVTVTVTY